MVLETLPWIALYIGGGLAVLYGALVIRSKLGYKPINDIVTDSSPEGLKLLEFKSTKPPQPYRRHFPETQRRMFPDFGPLVVSGRLDNVWDAVKRVISHNAVENRWDAKLIDDKDHVIEFTATTRLWRFVDDVRVVLTEQEGGNSVRIDARSKSRVGQDDMNANHKRLKYLFELIKDATTVCKKG